MNVAFYIDEMNFRGIANSTYDYALQNKLLLKNNSIIFYNKQNQSNKIEVIKKFKKKFKTFGINQFSEIDEFKNRLKIEYLYTQKSGNKDDWISKNIKTLVHCVYPQKINEIHGHKYAYISEWLSQNFSNKKIPYVPYIVKTKETKKNLKKKLKIKKDSIIFGCHGGESSFDMKFARSALINIVKKRKNIYFIFLNIEKFCNHGQIKFLKGTSDEFIKKKFINTCDAMIYGRSLGESFGLACGEFVTANKQVISYKFNRHRSHKFNISNEHFQEYGSYQDLCKLILNFKKRKIKSITKSKYKKYNAKEVMKIFKKVYYENNAISDVNYKDFIINYMNYTKMFYYYLRHKIYNHYFNLLEKRLINLRD